MKEFRVEKDFLGEKYVPIDAYYGIQTLRAVENFPITGYQVDGQLIKAIAIVKKSAAQANEAVGQLDQIDCTCYYPSFRRNYCGTIP